MLHRHELMSCDVKVSDVRMFMDFTGSFSEPYNKLVDSNNLTEWNLTE